MLSTWRARAPHEITVLALPGRHWKWRMRHAAWTLARRAAELAGDPDPAFDLVWATDMLDLAAWRGLAPPALARLPHVLYMHESQVAYPDAHRSERDLHFAFTNLWSAAAADHVWWNSAFHRDLFDREMRALAARMPDHAPTGALDEIARKSTVVYPPHDVDVRRAPRPPNAPPRILWVARWEPDKNPADFFTAVRELRARDVPFRLNVIGEPSAREPALFTAARRDLADRIDRWGWQPTRADYLETLAESDIVVSTAHHEFYGLAIVEAVAAGCYPLLPNRLAYPEVFAHVPADIFYDGTASHLVTRLDALLADPPPGDPSWARGQDPLSNALNSLGF